MSRSLSALVAVLALAVAGCGVADGDAPAEGDAVAEGTPRVVVTTSILGELVEDLVGGAAEVQVLVPPGQDPHGYAPSAQQAQQLRQADVVVANGLQLEEGLLDVLDAAEQDGVPVLRVADQLDPLPPAGAAVEDDHADEEDHADEDDHTDEEEAHDHGPLDPHVWLDPLRMADGAQWMSARFEELGIGDGEVDWTARGESVAADIRSLHEEVAAILDRVPDQCRRLVADHDSLGYLAARYDFEVVGSVAPGTSSQADPSAQEFAALADLVRRTGVTAVFVEVGQSTRLADALATEVQGEVTVVELYTGSLGEPGSGAEDYAGMLTTDARRIADALADC